MPPPPPGAEPAVIVGSRMPRPMVLPAGEPTAQELTGAVIRADLERIVAFSKESRTTKEFGAGQLWGRVSGFPSSARTVDWAVGEFRKAGIADVRVQTLTQDPKAPFWLPMSWEVRLIADPAFGAGTTDFVLQSAIPVAPSQLPAGPLTAPLVFVGTAGPAVLDRIDVRGKIAVQLTVPQGHMLFERAAVQDQAQALFKRGAVAVFNLVRLPGNELGRDFNNCGGPCFNIGGRDGLFLERLIERATAAGTIDKLRARLTLQTETFTGLRAQNGVAVVPGRRPDEVVIVDAHVDAWFDGAGDNADGLAVMLALARHFAKPDNRPERTLVFIASAGHHSAGMNGPRAFVAANPDLAQKAVLLLNIEHVAQRNFSPARSVAADGYRQAIADSGEAPLYAGVSNRAPFLDDLFQQGVLRYGTNFVSEPSDMESGETGGFSSMKVARITVMQAPPLYHTTGEVLDVISTPGLERIARFLAYFVREVAAAPATRINP
jgi:Peptidase family M28